MDRIAGLLPQIGWSPQTLPATPKIAPASMVEPAEKSAQNQAGLGADLAGRTPRDHAQAARGAAASHAYGTFAPEPPPDPDAPTGPPPTFEMTQLQAEAARRKAGPVAAVRDAGTTTVRDTEPLRAEIGVPDEASAPEAPATANASERTADAARPASARNWAALAPPEPHKVDVTR